jgi:hypothetical protein
MEKQDLEALKELLRVIVLAIIPNLIASLEAGELDWRVLIMTLSIAALRAVDKWLHVLGKVDEDPTLIKGITRF